MTTTVHQRSLEEHHVSSDTPGPVIVITARIHGDEPAGEKACRAALKKFRSGKWALKNGRVIFFPSLHPEAARQNTRGITHDCNRGLSAEGVQLHLVTPNNIDQWVRDSIYRRVCDIRATSRFWITEQTKPAFYFLDLHSTPENAPPHVIVEELGAPNKDLARATGIPLVLTDWRKACLGVSDNELAAVYDGLPVPQITPLRKIWDAHNNALIHLAEACGYEGSLCVEGGQNKSTEAITTHLRAIAGYLHALGVLSAPDHDIPTPAHTQTIQCFERLFIQTGRDRITPDAQLGDIFLHRADGTTERREEGQRLLHVFPDAPTGRPLAFTARVA